MSDLIRVVDLEIHSCIGVPAKERRKPQKLLVTLEMETAGFRPAAKRDQIGETVDYAEVAERVKHFAEKKPRKLLETFAEELAAELIRGFALEKIRIEVKKFILPNAKYVSVQIERPVRES
jgi:dihydroneopterin aldolase